MTYASRASRCPVLWYSDDDCNGGTCNLLTCTCSCPPCHNQVSAGCEFSCECENACVGGTCDSSQCTDCTSTNAPEKCTEHQDCIIPSGSNEGKCVESEICTTTKDSLCDEAWSAVSGSGSGDQSAKCCPSTSSCIKSAIGVKATSTCSTSCGSSCLGATRKNDRDSPTVFCRFGSGIGTFIYFLLHQFDVSLGFSSTLHYIRTCLC